MHVIRFKSKGFYNVIFEGLQPEHLLTAIMAPNEKGIGTAFSQITLIAVFFAL